MASVVIGSHGHPGLPSASVTANLVSALGKHDVFRRQVVRPVRSRLPGRGAPGLTAVARTPGSTNPVHQGTSAWTPLLAPPTSYA